jgi:hypothetical protein
MCYENRTIPKANDTVRRGNSTGLGVFLMSRARIRALARISSIDRCRVPGFFGVSVAMQ